MCKLRSFCLFLWDNPSNQTTVKLEMELNRGVNLTDELFILFHICLFK